MYGTQILASFLSHSFGLLSHEIRSKIAQRCKHGDVMDKGFYLWIVNQVDDIKRNMNDWARNDLESSLCFLKEGIHGLYQSLLQLNSNENTTEFTGQAKEQATLARAISQTLALILLLL